MLRQVFIDMTAPSDAARFASPRTLFRSSRSTLISGRSDGLRRGVGDNGRVSCSSSVSPSVITPSIMERAARVAELPPTVSVNGASVSGTPVPRSGQHATHGWQRQHRLCCLPGDHGLPVSRYRRWFRLLWLF